MRAGGGLVAAVRVAALSISVNVAARQLADPEFADDVAAAVRKLVADGLDGDVLIKLARCCTPVPGDDIQGFVTRGDGVSVHRTDCVNLLSLRSQPERLVGVRGAVEQVACGHEAGGEGEVGGDHAVLREPEPRDWYAS